MASGICLWVQVGFGLSLPGFGFSGTRLHHYIEDEDWKANEEEHREYAKLGMAALSIGNKKLLDK